MSRSGWWNAGPGIVVSMTLAAAAVAQPMPASDGDVRRVDRDAGKLTIRHGEIVNLGMPPMTMVFQVKDPALLDRVNPGDRIRFRAEQTGSTYFITEIESLAVVAQPSLDATPHAAGGASHAAGAASAGAASAGAASATDSRAAAVSVIQPWVRSTRPGQRSAAGYLEVRAPAGDRLLGVRLSQDVASRTELHTMRMDGDLMVMREVETFDVGAGTHLVLAPGGNHLMMMDLKKPLAVGESVHAVLVFEKAGDVPVRMEVRDAPPSAAAGSHGARGRGAR
jgi:copper(I)-binding protein/Cu/Ag efflux protein CusF